MRANNNHSALFVFHGVWIRSAVEQFFQKRVGESIGWALLVYTTPLPEENFILLRIEENVIGIALSVILTVIISPVFAIDLLKKNIQS